jgi:hypothetical protein
MVKRFMNYATESTEATKRTSKIFFWVLIPAVLLITLMLASCSKFTAPERFEGDIYTLAGLLYAGQPINAEHPVYITRSDSIEDFNIMNLFVSDATVLITDTTANEQWNLEPIIDLTEMKIKYVDPDAHIILPGHTYSIEVSIVGRVEKITASTTVPPAVELIPDIYNHGGGYSLNEAEMNDIVYNEIDQKYPLTLNTGSFAGSCNYLAEMYCLEEFSTDLEFTTPVFGFTNPDTTMVDEYYASGESIRRIKFMGPFNSQPQPDLIGNYLLVRDYRQAFAFYGRYRVSQYLIDDNYYHYSFMPEGYFHGGVKGGLGYFGSASGGKMYCKVVK